MQPRQKKLLMLEVPVVLPPAQVHYVPAAPTFKQFYQSDIKSFNTTEDFIKQAMDYIKLNEGKKNTLYYVYGKPHIGIGHLVRPEELLLYKNKVLSDTEIETLFAKDLQKKLQQVKSQFGSAYDNFSSKLKIVILDGYFRGDLSGSPNTLNLLKQGKYADAAAEYLDNNEYRAAKIKHPTKGVAARMERNAAAMEAELNPQ